MAGVVALGWRPWILCPKPYGRGTDAMQDWAPQPGAGTSGRKI